MILARATHSEGFTLLELLVAMTLAALLSVVLFGGLHFGRKAWETAQTATTRINDVRRLQELLGHALARAYPAQIGDVTQPHVDFSGGMHDLRFLAPDPQTDGALAYFAVTGDSNSVAIRVVPELSDGQSRAAAPRIVRGTLALSYYGAKKGTQAPQWYRDWQDQPRLPSLIRLDATGDHGTRSTIDVALRIDAPADCAINPLTHDCQDR